MDDQVDIKLSEINQQRKTNTVCYDLNVELKGKKNKYEFNKREADSQI